MCSPIAQHKFELQNEIPCYRRTTKGSGHSTTPAYGTTGCLEIVGVQLWAQARTLKQGNILHTQHELTQLARVDTTRARTHSLPNGLKPWYAEEKTEFMKFGP